MKLTGIMIGTEDSKKLGEFYTKVLGEPGWQQGDWYGFGKEANDSNLIIGPHSEVKGKNQEPARFIIPFVVDDVKAEFDRIKETGATVVAEPYQPNAEENAKVWLATFSDPDGNYFQLATPMEM